MVSFRFAFPSFERVPYLDSAPKVAGTFLGVSGGTAGEHLHGGSRPKGVGRDTRHLHLFRHFDSVLLIRLGHWPIRFEQPSQTVMWFLSESPATRTTCCCHFDA